MNVTRRSLVHLLTAATAVSASVAAQAPSTDDDLKIQRDQMRANFESLAKVPIPMAVEPAFHFKA
jgi:hypothetical protein